MGRIKDFFLDSIVDPLAVKYLKGRVKKSDHWRGLAEHDNFFGASILDMYVSPRQAKQGHKWLTESETFFGNHAEEILSNRPDDHYVVVLDAKAGKWEYARNLAEADRVMATMEGRPYARPIGYAERNVIES